jgi:hypothetical protein
MRARVSGTVLEIMPEMDDKKNLLATVTAVIFQKGEIQNIKVKKIPPDIVAEGEMINDLPVRVTTYDFNGRFGMSVNYAEEWKKAQ